MSSPPGRLVAALQDAVRLVEQGYRLEHVEQVTGFAAAHVRGQLRGGKGCRGGSTFPLVLLAASPSSAAR
jgi:hypothetical protein